MNNIYFDDRGLVKAYTTNKAETDFNLELFVNYKSQSHVPNNNTVIFTMDDEIIRHNQIDYSGRITYLKWDKEKSEVDEMVTNGLIYIKDEVHRYSNYVYSTILNINNLEGQQYLVSKDSHYYKNNRKINIYYKSDKYVFGYSNFQSDSREKIAFFICSIEDFSILFGTDVMPYHYYEDFKLDKHIKYDDEVKFVKLPSKDTQDLFENLDTKSIIFYKKGYESFILNSTTEIKNLLVYEKGKYILYNAEIGYVPDRSFHTTSYKPSSFFKIKCNRNGVIRNIKLYFESENLIIFNYMNNYYFYNPNESSAVLNEIDRRIGFNFLEMYNILILNTTFSDI